MKKNTLTSFERKEIKYLITPEQKQAFLKESEKYLKTDENGADGKYQLMSLYYDSPDKAFYREKWMKLQTRKKIRLRRYVGENAQPTPTDMVFIEIKEHTPQMNYKRRIQLRLDEAYALLEKGELPRGVRSEDQELIHEILDLRRQYQLQPSALTSYHRTAYKVKKQYWGVRITFDSKISYRVSDLSLLWQSQDASLVESGLEVMEIKVKGALPEWMQSLFDKYQIRPIAFSKYAQAIELGFAGELHPPLESTIDPEYDQQWNALALESRIGAFEYAN